MIDIKKNKTYRMNHYLAKRGRTEKVKGEETRILPDGSTQSLFNQ